MTGVVKCIRSWISKLFEFIIFSCKVLSILCLQIGSSTEYFIILTGILEADISRLPHNEPNSYCYIGDVYNVHDKKLHRITL